MKLYTLLTVLLTSLFLLSCNNEGSPEGLDFVAAFNQQSINYNSIQTEKEIKFIFSKIAQSDGYIYIKVKTENATYGTDFITLPKAENNQIIIPIKKGENSANFIFNNLIYPFDRSDKKIEFQITKVDYPGGAILKGYTSLVVSFGSSIGNTLSPEVGGPNQPYQVYVDLSKDTQTKVKRDSWDLGFYSGTKFRVILNGSIYMATKALEETDLSKVTSSSVKEFLGKVKVQGGLQSYIDHPDGDILKTAIAEIKNNDDDNPVYLLNLGHNVGTKIPTVGSAAVEGSNRGWKKIKFLKRGEDYLIRYADLDDTTFHEKRIQKKSEYNFTFFSFSTNNEVSVEPEKTRWDLNFTVFINFMGNGIYGFTDFVVNNLKAGVKVYKVNVERDITYESFDQNMIDESKFTNDQRAIGSSWRSVFPPRTVFNNRFYILKDVEGNIYKLRMISFLNDLGERGYPKFEYKLIK